MQKIVVRCPRCREVVDEIDPAEQAKASPRECLCRRKTERIDVRQLRQRLALAATAVLFRP